MRHRNYFIYHRDHRGREARIGKVVTSRSTGELIVPVSMINAADAYLYAAKDAGRNRWYGASDASPIRAAAEL